MMMAYFSFYKGSTPIFYGYKLGMDENKRVLDEIYITKCRIEDEKIDI